MCGYRLFSSKVFKRKYTQRILRNYTQEASSISEIDFDDKILDFALMLYWNKTSKRVLACKWRTEKLVTRGKAVVV